MALPVKKTIATTASGTAVEAESSRGTRTKTNIKPGSAPAFVRANTEMKRRLVASIQGPEKTGKNHMAFSYTGGGPIYVHSFDIGLEGVVQKFQQSREIFVAEYELDVQPGDGTEREVGQSANKVWDSFVSNFKDSLASTREEGLVIVDTGTEVWELMRLASFGKLGQVMPHMYSKPNAEMREVVRHSYDGSNVLWLHKMKDEWVNDTNGKGSRTGNKKFAGFSDMPFLVQVTVQTYREDNAVDQGGGSTFSALVTDCRLNPDLNNNVIDNDFDQLVNLVLG